MVVEEEDGADGEDMDTLEETVRVDQRDEAGVGRMGAYRRRR